MEQTNEQRIQFVQDRLLKNKVFFQRQSGSSKAAWSRIKTATILVSALVTVILGFKATDWFHATPEATGNLALVLSALVTALATADSTFDFQWTWTNYSLTLTKIYSLEDKLEYLVAGNDLTTEKLDSIFYDLQEILAGVNLNWTRRRLHDAGDGATADKN